MSNFSSRRVVSTERIVEIEQIGDRGDGVADGPVYVPYTAPGDRARISLGRQRRGGGIAGELIDLLEPSAIRAEPACRHFGDCGGCAAGSDLALEAVSLVKSPTGA